MIQIEQSDSFEGPTTDSMTPMIDVILSLIAFMMLMINAPLLTMDVDLPNVERSEYSAPSESKVLNLSILEQPNQWNIDGKKISSRDELEEALKEHVLSVETPPVTLLSIDEKSSAQRMIDTLDILNRLGIKDTQIALEKSSVDS
ncbi:ExbD/TolR family protein [Vibrio ziniensis]|uniref:Biopolymer transporter ExbD n=1 Tax=Vibrio ziniensis TaxID=2711221 RepID=A0A6G7CP02_9VIBR|nr:biopolymer transporter ExbD [Vibrio ziniensis]QIH43871.1 biopolymer transporter ExbD [Vibrio ziniensis]